VSGDAARSPLELYLGELVLGARAGQLLEIRWAASSTDMHRRFLRADATEQAARLIAALASRADVYVGVVLRERRHGGKRAIAGSRLLFVECDRLPDSQLALSLPPTIEIASGTPQHRHLYWRLDAAATNERVESANRRLAHALGGDPRSVDVARILRPPDTLNHKTAPPRAVRLLALRPDARYSLAQLLAELPPGSDALSETAAQAPRILVRTELDRRLRAIPASDYVLALTGRRPDRQGKVLCPFHSEQHPSLQLYRDGSFYCFGCGRGGSIIDFAAALWGCSTRGEEFLALRVRLARRLAPGSLVG
jgi:CHC2 zinc finger/RepB DNA-primase from phage plasmid